jgi:hypothetical protein
LVSKWHGILLLGFCAVVWVGIRRLGYHEFEAVAGILRLRLLRGLLNERLRLRSFEESLLAAATPDEYWGAVKNGARDFGFNSIELELQGKTYAERLRDAQSSQWAVRVPLRGSDYVQLTRDFRASETVVTIAPFIHYLHRTLG